MQQRLRIGFHYIFIFLLATISLSSVCFADYENIRVRLFRNLPNGIFEGERIRILANGSQWDFSGGDTKVPQRIKISRRLIKKEWHWEIVNLLDPQTRMPARISDLTNSGRLIILGSRIRIGQTRLSSVTNVLPAATGKGFDLVGVIDLENYLEGVLAGEMPSAWPIEALKAQAVVARSYAMAMIRQKPNADFHVESSVQDQVFLSPVDSKLSGKLRDAVLQTEGEYLEVERGEPLKAFYHSDCGGKTTTSTKVWGIGVDSGTAIDRSCPNNPKARWQFDISTHQLEKNLKNALKLGNSRILHVQALGGSSGERWEKVELILDSGKTKQILANEFRSLLGYSEVRSTRFRVEKTATGFHFEGIGFGHGVGLCQWGSRALALAGNQYDLILKHYYPRARFGQKLMNTRSAKNATAETAISL